MCAPGAYFNADEGLCKLCDVDTYNDEYDNTVACKACPLGATTGGERGATNLTACECFEANGLVEVLAPDGFVCSCNAGLHFDEKQSR